MSTSESAVRIKRQAELTTDSFLRLLAWLDGDRERAGEKYETIRRRLIKIFICRGCLVPEDLADETFDRVAAKVDQVAEGYVGDPALYFYGVAVKIYQEYRRKTRLHFSFATDPVDRYQPIENGNLKYECLDRCMEGLAAPHRELIIVYYGNSCNGKEKIAGRMELAQRLGIGANALWIRAHRIREVLKKCLRKCLHGQQRAHSGRIDEGN